MTAHPTGFNLLLWRRFLAMARPYWVGEERWRARGLLALLIVLLLEAQVGHPLQVLPVVRHWIPHLRIESPAEWQRTLEAGLRDYLGD